MQYGWYSAKAAAQFGTVIYSTSFGEVAVTCVTDVEYDSGTGWDDIVPVGPVDNFIREDEQHKLISNMFGRDYGI